VSDPAARGLFPGRPGRTLRAAAVLAVFLALFILVDRLSGPRQPGRPPQAASATTAAPARPTTTAAPTTTVPTTTMAPATTTTATTVAPTTTTAAAQAPLKSAQGVTVQILNGTGELRVARDFKPRVRAAGYRIVNTANAVGDFPVSTVYYTDGNRDDALSFRRRFPAFSKLAPAPANLSSQVELHVIIGANFHP
jgi:hypothetical protein